MELTRINLTVIAVAAIICSSIAVPLTNCTSPQRRLARGLADVLELVDVLEDTCTAEDTRESCLDKVVRKRMAEVAVPMLVEPAAVPLCEQSCPVCERDVDTSPDVGADDP